MLGWVSCVPLSGLPPTPDIPSHAFDPSAALPLPRIPSHLLHARQRTRSPLSGEDVARCAHAIAASNWSAAGDGPVLLSYATGQYDEATGRSFMPSAWHFGLSAALHKVPIAIVGVGNPGWGWWEGGLPKLAGLRRAAQVLREVAPAASLMMTDSSDVIVANKPTAAGKRLLESSPRTVWLAAECNSWPVCYRDHYAADEAHQRCVAEHGACYPNSGIAIGRTDAMHPFFDAVLHASDAMGKDGPWHAPKIEQGNDQSIFHHLYLNRSRIHADLYPRERTANADAGQSSTTTGVPAERAGHAAGGGAESPAQLDLQVDGAGRFSIQLWTCEGGEHDGPIRRFRSGNAGFEYCHYRTHRPLASLRAIKDGMGLVYNGSRAADGASSAPPHQHPWLLHANGRHYQMKSPSIAPLLEVYTRAAVVAPLLDHPVLLLEGAHAACEVRAPHTHAPTVP